MSDHQTQIYLLHHLSLRLFCDSKIFGVRACIKNHLCHFVFCNDNMVFWCNSILGSKSNCTSHSYKLEFKYALTSNHLWARWLTGCGLSQCKLFHEWWVWIYHHELHKEVESFSKLLSCKQVNQVVDCLARKSKFYVS